MGYTLPSASTYTPLYIPTYSDCPQPHKLHNKANITKNAIPFFIAFPPVFPHFTTKEPMGQVLHSHRKPHCRSCVWQLRQCIGVILRNRPLHCRNRQRELYTDPTEPRSYCCHKYRHCTAEWEIQGCHLQRSAQTQRLSARRQGDCPP